MSQTPPDPAKKKPGRPPSQAARQAVLDAAYRILMDEGLARLTIERVAAEAGVGKPTIYRTWTNAQDLAMAAFMARPDADIAMPRTKSARAAWAAHVASVIRTLGTHRGRQITLTMASADPEDTHGEVAVPAEGEDGSVDTALPEVEGGAGKTLRLTLAVASSPLPLARPRAIWRSSRITPPRRRRARRSSARSSSTTRRTSSRHRSS